MRRPLGPLLLATLATTVLPFALAGCGDGNRPEAVDSATSTSATTPPDDPPAEARLVDLLSATGGGGKVAPVATEVDRAPALDSYVGQFRSTALASQVRQAVAKARAGGPGSIWAQVVAVGCDIPPGAGVDQSTGRVVVTPQEVTDPLQECLAPVSTVAVVTRG